MRIKIINSEENEEQEEKKTDDLKQLAEDTKNDPTEHIGDLIIDQTKGISCSPRDIPDNKVIDFNTLRFIYHGEKDPLNGIAHIRIVADLKDKKKIGFDTTEIHLDFLDMGSVICQCGANIQRHMFKSPHEAMDLYFNQMKIDLIKQLKEKNIIIETKEGNIEWV